MRPEPSSIPDCILPHLRRLPTTTLGGRHALTIVASFQQEVGVNKLCPTRSHGGGTGSCELSGSVGATPAVGHHPLPQSTLCALRIYRYPRINLYRPAHLIRNRSQRHSSRSFDLNRRTPGREEAEHKVSSSGRDGQDSTALHSTTRHVSTHTCTALATRTRRSCFWGRRVRDSTLLRRGRPTGLTPFCRTRNFFAGLESSNERLHAKWRLQHQQHGWQ